MPPITQAAQANFKRTMFVIRKLLPNVIHTGTFNPTLEFDLFIQNAVLQKHAANLLNLPWISREAYW